MRFNQFKSGLMKSGIAASVLLLAGGAASAQSVSLTAGPSSALLPDGSGVPMWGYTCGTVTPATGGPTCAALNPNAGANWSPVVITVPVNTSGSTSLTIQLTNNLSFNNGNTVPTSLTIVGQVGGGLGTPTSVASPAHGPQGVTWAVPSAPDTSATAGGDPSTAGNPTNQPPTQGPRVQSFGTEVLAGTPASLTWKNLRPGTYLIESGTHPSIQGPMGLYGILVVTTAPTADTTGKETAAGTAYPALAKVGNRLAMPAVTYDGEIPIIMSEIDPYQNAAVSAAVNTAGFSETTVWSGQPGNCGNPTSTNYQTCYPPAVNYTPLYYLMNGVAFSKANAGASLFAVAPTTLAPASGSGSILVRLVNAGLRMHVPSIVGSQTTGWNGGNGDTAATSATVGGFQLIAEDGNRPAGIPKVQSDVFMAAGKTFDLMINAPVAPATCATPPCAPPTLPIFDRELSLSANQINRDAGMLAYIGVNGAQLPSSQAFSSAQAVADTYNSIVPGQAFTVSDPSKGLLANDSNVYGVKVVGTVPAGLTLNENGTFTYTAGVPTTFTYCGNGATSGAACATVTLGAATIEASSGITCLPSSFSSTVATFLSVKTPGVLASCTDAAGYPLTVDTSSVTASGANVAMDVNGGFTATTTGMGTPSFTFKAKNSQGTESAAVTVSLTFPAGSGLKVQVIDGADHKTLITDYRWVIEEDRTFYINPLCTQNPLPAACVPAVTGGATAPTAIPTLGVNFHTSYMPFVAQGCTGPLSCEAGQTVLGVPSVCDVSNGVCHPGAQKTAIDPSQVYLDPTKRYYFSVLPGDAANPFGNGGYGAAPVCTSAAGVSTPNATCGHGMGGAPITIDPNTGVDPYIGAGAKPLTVLTQPAPYPPGKLSVFVFEDDFPLNGEQDGGGGTVDVLSTVEPGLGGFQIHLWDAMGGNGDFTGQMTYDMFNQPLTNSLDGTVDPATGNNACPITQAGINNPGTNATDGPAPTDSSGNVITAQTAGITGMIVTCPKYESDKLTPSPLAGQAVIANLMPGRWGVVATPGADRISRGEEWLQTNTLDGQKAHDSFVRIGEPSYFQEFGPASFHVSIGFANPAIINQRHATVCSGQDPNLPNTTPYKCNNTIKGRVVGEHLSRTPDERLYPSGSHDAFAWSQCYVSFGDPDGEDFAFTKCNADGTFEIDNLPPGDWRVTTFDQWNDALVDGLSTPVGLGTGSNASCGPGSTTTLCNMGDIAATQWETNLYTRTFIDDNKDGVSQSNEDGIPFLNVAVRLRDGSIENLLTTDFTGTTNFNETFPLFSWYVVETDVTRYKNTGTHVVYDVGGPTDGSTSCGVTGYPPCGVGPGGTGSPTISKYLANTAELVSVPTALRIPGAVYCADADCSGKGMPGNIDGLSSASANPSSCTTDSTTGATTCTTQLSSGRIDPPWVGNEGWQGFPGQNNFLEFGKEPYVAGENGGIKGHVVYASTRPFDDPQMLVQTQWEPLIPNVTINLYQEGVAADGVTRILTLVDTTKTTSFDDFAQGFRADGTPNMNCPGQGASSGAIPDLFFFSLQGQPDYIDLYNNEHNGGALHALPNNSQFKCYDGMHNWNQLQPVPYDGQYKFPSVTATDANGKPATTVDSTGKFTGTNCKICVADPVGAPDMYAGIPMLPAGKYVVEVVVPPGFELVKEEDKNILIGDDYIGPVTQQIGGLGNIFILPDQASVASAATTSGIGYNANNAQNPTQTLGAQPSNSIVPGFVPEPTWPCVGTPRVVPDYISLYPWTQQVAPFAGATRNLCDRKEVTLGDQQGAIAKFYLFTSTHIAAKFTGGITDDYTSEFDPFSPQFGEKFSPPDLPVGIKDWAGNETNRVYADHWGSYNGMTYSTWEVNPPNPTGYAPSMMVFCMNDPGPILDTKVGSPTNGQMITDPLFAEGYSQFCYELPFMPGTTQYLDTPVVPTSAFAGAGYNNVDCAYPDATPAVASVVNTNAEKTLPAKSGPWVSASGGTHQLTITALGNQTVPNNAYSGPSATTAPYNQKTIVRHYGFGTTPSTCPATGGCPNVTIGGVAMTNVSWSDGTITGTVPSGVPNCLVQQQTVYGGSTAQCGELVIKAGNGKQSVDAVTVTIGGKTPTLAMTPGSTPQTLTQYSTGTIQNAIDAAAPGDLIILPAGTYSEMVLMWKPVRLQGVGAASTIINANTQPAGKLDPWRREVNCLFGLALDGTPLTATHSKFDPTGSFSCAAGSGGANFTGTPTTLQYFAPQPTGRSGAYFSPQIDRLPLEAVVGWDATLNGNLAQLLQEATLMGALEGAGITVLGKGVEFPADSNPFAADTFPTGTTLLSGGSSSCPAPATTGRRGTPATITGPLASNFYCNPSSINSLSITDSSQGGGAVFLHAWAHNMDIANNRIKNNAGTLSGGINVGQGEFPPPYIAGSTTNADPGSCATTNFRGRVSFNGTPIPAGAVEPYCQNVNVNVHNNYVSLNSSTGDELFSATPAGAGGVSFCTGADNYKFNYNWVCGNLSSGDGGGLGHLGVSYNGDIEHNTFLFNQSLNPTIPANGGAMVIMGSPDVDPACSTVDQDCVDPLIGPNGQPIPPSVGPSDGIGPNLVINANLIMGNGAEAGTGGGISFQNVNGSDVVAFPTTPANWWHVTVTNNIIADNVAGWDGGGISLLDALNIDIVNNTIVGNSTTASAGILFTTLGAPLASQPGNTGTNPSSGINCTNGAGRTASCPQVAGLVSEPNSSILTANLPATGVVCPANHYTSATAAKGNCTLASVPELFNNLIWQNSAYYIGVGSSVSNQFQQNVVTLYNAFTTTVAPTQPSADSTAANGVGTIIAGGTGACVPGASYWDIGVRGDTAPGNHTSGVTLAPSYSTLTNPAEAGLGANNEAGINPGVVSQYCDGSRQPPEWGQSGWAVPPGISDATVPNPIFNLTPVATVDEGNNWINLRWGPLTLVNPVTGATLGNYAPAAGSPVINYITNSAEAAYDQAPSTDFFGNPRKAGNAAVDIGAVQHPAGATEPAILVVLGGPLAFGNVTETTTPTQTLTLRNDGSAGASGITLSAFPAGFSRPTGGAGGNCGATLAGGASCTIVVQFAPTAATTYSGTLGITASVTVSGSPVALSGTGIPVTRSATVTGGPLAFGTWATGTTSNAQTVTVTNTGSAALAGGTFTLGGGTPQPFARPTGGAGGSCTAALAVGATCTINVTFAPATGTTNNTAFSRTLTVAYTGATVTPSPSVSLTGTAVTARAPMAITPNPLTITASAPFTIGSGVVTLTNTAAAGGSKVLVSGVAATGGSFLTYMFGAGASAGLPDTCTGAVLAPQASCTVQVDFLDIFGAINTNHAGSVRFTDSGAGSPQSGALIGVAQ